MAEAAPTVTVDEDDSGLSPETKVYFEEAAKPAPKKKDEKPAAAEPAPADKGEKLTDKDAKGEKPAPDERESLKKAVDEERTRRKEIAEQLKAEAANRKQLEDRFNRFLNLVQQQGGEKPPETPEFATDPAGHLKAREQEIARRQEAIERHLTEQHQAGQQQQQLTNFRNHVAGQTQQFTRENADYGDAYNYMRDIRRKEMSAIGVPDEQVEPLLNQWEMQLAAAAVQLGRNPAQALYAQAQALGYAKKAAPAAAAAGEDKIDRLARGAEAAKSAPAGGQSHEPLSLERIMKMDEDELAEAVKGRNWQKVTKAFR